LMRIEEFQAKLDPRTRDYMNDWFLHRFLKRAGLVALRYDFALNTPSLSAYVDRCKARPSVRTSGWVETFHELVRARDPEQVLAAPL